MKAFLDTLPIDSTVDPIRMGEYCGYQLAAPASFWNATDEIINSLTGGCGPGGIGDYFVPDTIYGMSVKAACIIHDWCFGVWNDKAGFEIANNIFKNNMIRINNQNLGCGTIKRLRLKRIKKYFLAVHFFGEPSYYDSAVT